MNRIKDKPLITANNILDDDVFVVDNKFLDGNPDEGVRCVNVYDLFGSLVPAFTPAPNITHPSQSSLDSFTIGDAFSNNYKPGTQNTTVLINVNSMTGNKEVMFVLNQLSGTSPIVTRAAGDHVSFFCTFPQEAGIKLFFVGYVASGTTFSWLPTDIFTANPTALDLTGKGFVSTANTRYVKFDFVHNGSVWKFIGHQETNV